MSPPHQTEQLAGKFIAGLFWGQVGMSLRSAICFLVSILIARTLGADEFGIYSALVSLIAILILFTNSGIYSVFNKYIPQLASQEATGACSYLIRRAFWLRIMILLLVGAGIHGGIESLADFIGASTTQHFSSLLILWFVLRGVADFFLAIVMSRLDMKYYAFVETFISILQLLGTFYLIKSGMNLISLIVLMIAVYGLQFFLYMYGSRNTYMRKPEKIVLVPIVKYGLVIWLSSLIQYFLHNDTDTYMILYYLKNTALVGYYHVAYHIATTGGRFLMAAVSSLGLTILSESFAKRNMEGLRISWEFLYKISLFLSAPAFTFIVFQARNIIVSLYTTSFADASGLLTCLSIFYLASAFLGFGVTLTVLLPLNQEKWVLILRGAGGILNLLLNIVFIPSFGIIGAVIATGISFTVLASAELYVMINITDFRLPLSFIAKFIPIVIIPALFTLLLDQTGLTMLIFCALIYAILVATLALFFLPLSHDELDLLEELTPRTVKIMRKYKLFKPSFS